MFVKMYLSCRYAFHISNSSICIWKYKKSLHFILVTCSLAFATIPSILNIFYIKTFKINKLKQQNQLVGRLSAKCLTKFLRHNIRNFGSDLVRVISGSFLILSLSQSSTACCRLRTISGCPSLASCACIYSLTMFRWGSSVSICWTFSPKPRASCLVVFSSSSVDSIICGSGYLLSPLLLHADFLS